jgi:hypothetical protein
LLSTFCGWSGASRGAAIWPDALALRGQHGVDEEAVAARRGDAPCGGVRADDQAQLLQVGHHVADGGRRQLQARSLRQRARTHRLAVGDIALNQRFQQQPGTIIKHGDILRSFGHHVVM